ncbi:MAG: hypothetical protein LBB54_01390 [Cellulomonadaceae bacterium]|nr:hypothetical protein [Cellulomonadaceae bacterium]
MCVAATAGICAGVVAGVAATVVGGALVGGTSALATYAVTGDNGRYSAKGAFTQGLTGTLLGAATGGIGVGASTLTQRLTAANNIARTGASTTASSGASAAAGAGARVGTTGGVGPVNLGQAGEKAVQDAFDIGPKTPINLNGKVRIPDGLTDKVLTEVKNVKYQALTEQLRDEIAYSQKYGLRFDLFVRGGDVNTKTTLSKELQELVDNGTVNLRRIP